MPDIKTKAELATSAKTMAQSFELVQRGAATFIPVDWQTYSPDPPPPPEDRIWLPFPREQKQRLANLKYNVLFANDGELRSFDFMTRQYATEHDEQVSSILIRTAGGIRSLNADGKLVPHDGTFTPNYVRPLLNEDDDDKTFVFNTIAEWVGSEESAHSLLHHLATSLAPGWSAVKYVILLGEGRNGKSVLLTMLVNLFGQENVSNVTRQMMAERSPTTAELNNKLLNVIFDGEMAYIKDSSVEKTLIAGEPTVVRMLFESGTTKVQTNALFIEALNQEPKTRDKTSALQKRLVRFHFPNVYAVDKAFERKMQSERMLGALLSLLLDHYVTEAELAEKLAPTKGSLDLQLEQLWLGSPVLQFLGHLHTSDPAAIGKLETGKMMVDDFINVFKPWADGQGIHERSDGDLVNMLKSNFDVGWKTIRENGKPTSKRVIKGLKPETLMALAQLQGDLEAELDQTLVDILDEQAT